MGDRSLPGEVASPPSIAVGELLERLDRGDPLLLLDVRNADEAAAWRVEARRPVESLNVPYFAFVEDAALAMADLPRDRELVVLCAKGGSSAMVVDELREAGLPARNVEGGMVAYGEYLAAAPVPAGPGEKRAFELLQVNRRGKGCLSYVLVAGRDALVVDAARDGVFYERMVNARGARLVRVLETHIQADHVSGGRELAMRAGVPYSVHAGSAGEPAYPVNRLADGQRLVLGGPRGVEVEVLATPGHTPGSTSYLVGGRYLLSGDTLFVHGVGRPDLGGQAEAWAADLHRTLGRLGALPDETVVLPAHYASTSEMGADGVVSGRLGDLRREVSELALDRAAFVRAMVSAVREPPASYAEILRVNRGEAEAGEEQVREWELGKNECAAGHGQGR